MMPLFPFLKLYIFLYVRMRVFAEKKKTNQQKKTQDPEPQKTRTEIAALYRCRILFDMASCIFVGESLFVR